MKQNKKDNSIEFSRIFEELYPKLMTLARRYVDEPTSKDIVQEVFVSYWERQEEFQVERLHSFLFKWVQNKCLDHIKHQMVEEDYMSRVRVAEERQKYLNQTTDSNDVLNAIMSNELREIIEASVNKLPSKCKEAFKLSFFYEMTYKQIATLMNISHRTVEKHIYKAISILRDDLKKVLFLLFVFLT